MSDKYLIMETIDKFEEQGIAELDRDLESNILINKFGKLQERN